MNVLTKFGSFLGTVAFAVLAVVGYHQYTEVSYLNAHQPPTLAQIQANTVSLEMDNGGVCSGWIGTDGKLRTAAHCFEFDSQPHTATVYWQDGSQEVWKVESISTNSDDTLHDKAVLVPVDKTDHHVSGLKICSFKPYYGEFVSEFGAPYGVPYSVNSGWIQIPTTAEGLIALDVKVLPGNSGGAIVDREEGCVLGQAEQIFVGPYQIPYGVNLAIPVTEL